MNLMLALQCTLLTFFLLLIPVKGSDFDCSSQQLLRCKTNLEQRLLQGHVNRLSKLSQLELCADVRLNLDCLTWYASHCLSEQNRAQVGSLVIFVRDFLVRNCESEDQVNEAWVEHHCFRSDLVMTCNDKHTRGRFAFGSDCIRYNEYKSCLQRAVVERACDLKFTGSYLIDRTRKLAWMCQADDFRGVTALSQDFLPQLTSSLSCITVIVDDVHDCAGHPDNYRDGYQNPCCAFHKQLDCIKVASVSRCPDQTYLGLMKSFEETPTGQQCTRSDSVINCRSAANLPRSPFCKLFALSSFLILIAHQLQFN